MNPTHTKGIKKSSELLLLLVRLHWKETVRAGGDVSGLPWSSFMEVTSPREGRTWSADDDTFSTSLLDKSRPVKVRILAGIFFSVGLGVHVFVKL